MDPATRNDLMRYLDGEMPARERRRFEEALDGSTELRRELVLFDAMKNDLHDLSFSRHPTNGSLWSQVNRRLARPMGWLFLVVGAALWTGYGAYVFATSPGQLVEKLATGAVVIGILLLLASVIQEQYQAWLSDPYRDIQR
jgi:anti-sigma factor RsiW